MNNKVFAGINNEHLKAIKERFGDNSESLFTSLTADQLQAVIKKLGGEGEVLKILGGERVVTVKEVRPANFKVFMTLKIDESPKDLEEFLVACQVNNIEVVCWAREVLEKISFEARQGEVDLVKVKVGELGFKISAKLGPIYTRVRERGLELFPIEAVPQFRLAYLNQSKQEWLMVGMEPIVDSKGNLELFCLGRDGSLWLAGEHEDSEYSWNVDECFVFVKPRG